MKNEVYNIEGMHCSACSSAIERVTKKLDGVVSSQVNLPMNKLTISYDENLVNPQLICQKIEKAGFKAYIEQENQDEKVENSPKNENSNEKIKLIFSVGLSAILLYVSMGQMMFENIPIPEIFSMHNHPTNFAILQLLLAIIVIFLEKRFFISGFKSLFYGNPNMDTLVAISASASFLYSLVMTFLIDTNHHAVHSLYYESTAMVLALVSIGKYFEGINKEKTKGAIEKLINLTPEIAILVDQNGQWEVPTKNLKIGDIVLIKAGSSIPLDGVVTEGFGSANEAMITGESLPVEKSEKSEVIGGSILVSGVIFVKITKVGHDTTLAKIIRFVQDAQGKKAPISKLADKVSGIFVPIVIAISVFTAIIWLISGSSLSFALKIFTSVLVIACPCSLGLATPTSIIVATGLGANHGILIRNGESLENTHKVNVAIFDKTGTITYGKPVVCDVFCEKMEENEFLSMVISVEKLSNHPLAHAICKEEQNRELKIENFTGKFENLDGLGILATLDDTKTLAIGNLKLMQKINAETCDTTNLSTQGKTVMYVALNDEFLGYIAVSDTVKTEAFDTISRLKKMGIKTVMLTGDNTHTANYIAKNVGVDHVIAEVLPTQKAECVKKYQDNGDVVLMVGDGINDAPALTQADVSCAVFGGSDIAIESAEIVLMKDDLHDVLKAINLSKMTILNIKQNLFWAFCYNTLCIPVACGILYPNFGILLSPMIAGFAMSASSLFVVSNALRLKNKNIN